MDLMRRSSAGELSELFGSVAVNMDKERRVHRMRARVMQDLPAFAGDKLVQLQAYTDGVNAGLAAHESASLALPGAAPTTEAVGTGGFRTDRLRHVFRPSGFAEHARTGVVTHQGDRTGDIVRSADPRWHRMGCTPVRRSARQRDLAFHRATGPAQAGHASGRQPWPPGGQRHAGQLEQLGGGRLTDSGWSRHCCRRHAPGTARPKYLVGARLRYPDARAPAAKWMFPASLCPACLR